MGLNEYQSTALAYLLYLGESKATTISRISGIPSAKIYEVLKELHRMGLIKVKPGRPLMYSPNHPKDIVSSIISFNISQMKQKLRDLELASKIFIELSEKLYLRGKETVPTTPLLRIVRVGEISLEETRKLYDGAKGEILILSKAMEYFPEVKNNLLNAVSRGVSIKIILMNPELLRPEEKEKQSKILKEITSSLGSNVEIKFADSVPIRGCLIDPSSNGSALFLVEDPGIPYFLREAAITNHHSVVKGLALMFRLVWNHMAVSLPNLSNSRFINMLS